MSNTILAALLQGVVLGKEEDYDVVKQNRY